MRPSRVGSILVVFALASCASPKGGAVLGVHSPQLGEGNLLVDDVGLMIPDEGFAPVLNRGCELPCKGSFHVRTSSQDQERIRVRLFRRSLTSRGSVSRLGDFQIVEIPPGPARSRVIEVTLRAKKDRLSIYAVERETGENLTIRTILLLGE